MTRFSASTKIYVGLILILAVFSALSVFLPTFQALMPTEELPASRPVLALVNAGIAIILYGILGFLGLKLAQKLGFASIWDEKISNRQRFLFPALIGVGIGVLFVIADTIFSQFHAFGPLPHPQFPASIVASLTAGIGEEILFRLFFIPFWVWLISYVILGKRWQNQIFGIVTIVSALTFALGHIPAMLVLFSLNKVNEIPVALMAEIILLNGVVSLFAAHYFRKFGFLAAVGIHFWTDVIWHVIWGVFNG
jgi:membrane protease YdiL (CAAX protease family)